MVGISDLLDSDVEDSHNASDENSVRSISPAESRTNSTATKKGKKRRCVTMPKAKSRVTKAVAATGAKKPATKAAAAKLKAAEAQVEQDGDEIQETQAPPPAARGRGRAKKATVPEPVKEEADDIVEETMEVEPSPAAARSSHAPSRGRKAVPKPVKEAAPTKGRKATQTTNKAQPEPLPEDELLESEEDEMQIDEPQVARNVSRNNSRLATSFRRRAGSASDTERGDPNLRRKLGDVTRKFENIDMKYRNLKEVGVNEATANMEKLRKQCDATTQASNELIASLKKELSQQAPAVQDSRKLKKQVQTSEQELAELRKANSTLSASLSSAQNEIKNLHVKLAAARSSSAAPAENPKGPGSGTAKHHPASRNNGPNPVAESAQTAQMKEELYRDLTGLIVRSVKRSDDGDTYDCIQTGRNGSKFHPNPPSINHPLPFSTSIPVPSARNTYLANHTHVALHFKLFVDAEEARTASFLETEFLYTPLLDANRDGDMIELMPTYLTEEITFAREDASKFYCRVLDTLTKRRVEAEEE